MIEATSENRISILGRRFFIPAVTFLAGVGVAFYVKDRISPPPSFETQYAAMNIARCEYRSIDQALQDRAIPELSSYYEETQSLDQLKRNAMSSALGGDVSAAASALSAANNGISQEDKARIMATAFEILSIKNARPKSVYAYTPGDPRPDLDSQLCFAESARSLNLIANSELNKRF